MVKNLLIETLNGAKIDGTDKWLPMTAVDAFIDQIKTLEGNEQASIEQFNTLVSGVPSPWARVKLTSYALADNTDSGDKRTLIECYRHMRSEWRGLIAAYVLYSDRFQISDPISLSRRSIKETYGRFDVRSVLGNMLFNEASLWRHSSDVDSISDAAPCIQLLYYSDQSNSRTLVGATSPYTIFFAATNYSLTAARNNDDIYWIDSTGKFIDPTVRFGSRGDDPKEVNNIRKIVSFLKNISSKREAYSNELIRICGEAYRIQVFDIERSIGSFIDSWLRDIRSINPAWVDEESIPVTINIGVKPAAPLAKLFDTSYTYYWYDGTFSMTQKENAVTIEDVQSLFIDSKYIVGFKCLATDTLKFENAPVTYIRAEDDKKDFYFCALPFSRFAIEECMKSEIPQIILGKNDNVRLEATVKSNILKAVLRAKIQNNWVDILAKEFILVEPNSIGHVFTWPNFASKIWTQYYYYSEYPTNGSGLKMLPIFKSLGNEEKVDFLTTDLNNMEESMKDMFLVRYPIGQVDTTEHRYEIIRSKYPVQLLAVKVDRDEKECLAGFFMIKTKSDMPSTDKAMRIINMDQADNLAKASVGIDFGSTNTCAYYNSKMEDRSYPIPFANRRLALIGFDNPARSLAQKHELYFISNEEPINKNGQIKSWLHEHNPLYINAAKAENELVGGVPVNETNITVKAINENVITTNAGTLCSNMKWLSDVKGVGHKKSFMRTIWMQICADLFDKGIRPAELFWSYPSAMGHKDITSMKQIYNELRTTPIEGVMVNHIKSHTESEAVCSYAMTKDVALTEKRLFLGIDIGGSTSDILIMGRKDGATRLFSQCSIRMAANHFFRAINSSSRFRQALYKFHESKTTNVKVINIADVVSTDPSVYGRSPYYLNNIFDQLNGGVEFRKFYNSLNQNVPFVFALPCYVTGILVFYAGMLVRNAIRVNKLEDMIEAVHMRYYGKGGRTFEWIYGVYEDEARSYYAKCFKSGFGDDNIRFSCDNVNDLLSGETLENKSEVAMGLVNLKTNIGGIYEASDDDALSVTPVEFLSEVFGEKGFSYTNAQGERIAIDELDIVDGSFYQNLHNPETFENFYRFMNLYAKFLDDTGIINEVSKIQELKNKRTSIDNVMQFFDNDKEYKKYLDELAGADGETRPSYRMPIFIAEALYYLEKVLLPGVFRE